MNVGIIGSGTMGSGIAQVAATSGCKVKLYDTNQAALDKAKSALEKILARLVEKGRIDTAEKSRIQNNISYIVKLKDLADSDLTIEEIEEKQRTLLDTYDLLTSHEDKEKKNATTKPKRNGKVHKRIKSSD